MDPDLWQTRIIMVHFKEKEKSGAFLLCLALEVDDSIFDDLWYAVGMPLRDSVVKPG